MAAAVAAAVVAVGGWGTVAAIAVSVASMAYSFKMAKDAKNASQDPAERKQILRSSSASKNYIYGKTRSSGVLTFAQEQPGSQDKGEQVHIVLACAGHKLNRISDVLLNEEPLVDFGSYAEFEPFPEGRTTVDPFLSAKCPDWKDTMIGEGFAWSRFTFKFDQEKFPSGLPNITMLKEGFKVEDPRTGTTAWSNNPALCILHYLRLKGWEDEYLILDAFKEAANICDEVVANNDGTTEKRYTLGCEFDDSDTPASVLDKMLASCGGEWVRVGGRIGLRVAAYYGPAFIEITEDEIIDGIEIQPEVERADAFNIVRGTYVEPGQNYSEVDYPEVRVQEWVTTDEEEIVMDVDLNYVQSPWQAQRLADIALKRNRLGMTLKLPCNLRGFQATPGTMINLSLGTIGFNKQEFMVVDWEFSIDNGVVLVVRRDMPSFYDDAVGKPVVAPPLINLPSGGIPAPTNPQFIARDVGDIVQGVIKWENSAFKVAHTNVLVKDSAGNLIQSAQVPFPGNELPLNGKLAGTYDIELQAVGVNTSLSTTTTMQITIDAPQTPDVVNVRASNWNIQLTPAYNLMQVPFGTLFEFYADETEQVNPPPESRKPDELASSWSHGGLTPDKYYYYWIRAVNSYGKSGWTQVTAQTTKESDLVTTVVEKLIGIEIYAPYIASDETANPAFVLDGRPDHGNGLIKGAEIIGSSMQSDNYVPGAAGYRFDKDGAEINGGLVVDAADITGELTAATISANNIVGDIVSSITKPIPLRTSPSTVGRNQWVTILATSIANPRPYPRTFIIQNADYPSFRVQLNVSTGSGTESAEMGFRLVDSGGNVYWSVDGINVTFEGASSSRWAEVVCHTPSATIASNVSAGSLTLQVRCTTRDLSQIRVGYNFKDNVNFNESYIASLFKDSGELS